MASLTAKDIMTSEATFSPDMDIYRAMEQLLKRQLTGAPVVDENHMLIGMLTERDCLKVLVGGVVDGLPGGTVSDYMTSPAESIGPTARLSDIVHIFLTRSYRKLPVVAESGAVIGQVSRREALLALESMQDNPRLFGADDTKPYGTGVDSAMRIARREEVACRQAILTPSDVWASSED